MKIRYLSLIASALLCFECGSVVFAASNDPSVLARGTWSFNETNTSISSAPTNLKFFKSYDVLPDDITLPIVVKKDMSALRGKKIFVGYGVADPRGENCRTFDANLTSTGNAISVCLPWWRIEREYNVSTATNPINNFKDKIPLVYPPKVMNVCKKWKQPTFAQGGYVTCTSYYDKNKNSDCFSNPKQAQCFKDNCAADLKKNCDFIGTEEGQTTTLKAAYSSGQGAAPQADDGKVGLKTHQFKCPDGNLTGKQCIEDESVIMYPYECRAPNPSAGDRYGEYVYCDKSGPIYGGDGRIAGFTGKCKDGRAITCQVNNFAYTTKKCVNERNESYSATELLKKDDMVNYQDHEINVLSGAPDIYSDNPRCLRMNTVAQSRGSVLTMISSNGQQEMDDDIYVLKHKPDASYEKIYCTTQHVNGATKVMPDGSSVACFNNGNDGKYAINNQQVELNSSDVVGIQQSTEYEDTFKTPLYGRLGYGSSSLSIGNVVVLPETWGTSYRYMKTDYGWPIGGAIMNGFIVFQGGLLRTWDNATVNLALMFPYAGAYKLSFYDKNDNLLATSSLTYDDFKIMGSSYKQLKLGQKMQLANNMKDGNNTDACRDEDFVEWGGGVYGGRGSKCPDGSCTPCAKPREIDDTLDNVDQTDDYVREHSAYKLLVKDLLTGIVTPIELIYPLPYPNRVFVSKLALYENRKYRCYDDFATASMPNCTKVSESFGDGKSDYTNKTVWTKRTSTFQCDTVKTKTTCLAWQDQIVDGNLSFQIKDYYETKDFTNNFMQAISTAHALEQMQHIFSGWHGECEYGTFTDFSFLSDPMFWVSTVGSLYTAGSQGFFGASAQTYINDSIRNFGTSLNNTMGGLDGTIANYGEKLGSNLVSAAATNDYISTLSTADRLIQNLQGSAGFLAVASTLSPLLASPSKQEQDQAWSYQMAYTGQDNTNPQANAYASCMASIGLSFANLVSYSMGGDQNQTGSEIQKPWENPLRISWGDWQGLQANTGGAAGSTAFTDQYVVKSQDSIGITLVAKNQSAYTQLGQTLCGGYKMSQIMNAQQSATNTAKASGGNVGQAVAVNSAISAIGMVNPLLGLAANVAYKLMGSFKDQDACQNEEDAMAVGKLQFKTYKFKKTEQCHYVKNECSAKYFWGDCMRHRNNYCCFDQISTRIFAEGIKEQLGKTWDSCSDIALSDLKNISFKECAVGQDPKTDHCFAKAKYVEMQKAMTAQISKGVPIDNLQDQIKNSMALP